MKSKKIDTRLEDYLFALVDAYARRHGMKRTQVVVQAIEKFFGIEHADPIEFASGKILATPRSRAPETLILEDGPTVSTTDPSDASAGGSSTARNVIRYPKGTRRKSSN